MKLMKMLAKKPVNTRSPVTVSLPPAMVRRLDTLGNRRGFSRSRLFEALLLAGERSTVASTLGEELGAYYAEAEASPDRDSARRLAAAARLSPADEVAAPAVRPRRAHKAKKKAKK